MESRVFSKEDEARHYDLEQIACLLASPAEKLKLAKQMLKPSGKMVYNALGNPLRPISRKTAVRGAKEMLQQVREDLADVIHILERT